MRTEYWMRTKDTSHLNPEQSQNRFKILELLHRYWKNEIFPINTTHKQKIPQIRDQKGTMCAVAYVMYHSRQQNLISNIAQTNNNVLIDDVPDCHELIDSLKHNGISKKEAAKIQPSYDPGPYNLIDPVIRVITIALSIAGLAIITSFYWAWTQNTSNLTKQQTMIAVVLGIIALGGGGFGLFYQFYILTFLDYFCCF